MTVLCHLVILPRELAGQGPSWQGRTVAQWAARLEDQDQRGRWYAAYALGQIGPEAAQAVEPLIRVLRHRGEHEYVRGTAAWALGRIGAAEAAVVDVLAEVLPSQGHLSVRRYAAWALGQLGPAARSALPALRTRLDDPDPLVRVNAAAALWRIGQDRRGLAMLEKTAREGPPEAACLSVTALGSIAGESEESKLVLAALAAALRRPEADVQRLAADALARAGPAGEAQLRQALADPAEAVRLRAVVAVGRLGSAAEPCLLDALEDESPAVRRVAARQLRRLGEQAGREESSGNGPFPVGGDLK